MTTLRREEFDAFYRAVHGYDPFPWQSAYVKAVAEGEAWLDLDVPTGLGKTSLIDAWVFLLAWQTANGRARTVPLRLFFVVDRRLIVDQAYEHARVIQQALDDAPAGSLPGRVAQALTRLGGGRVPLEVVRMRGGVDWASRWLRSPAQPAVVTSTVDQYGSRLCFRGYHTSPRMRPIDAALCGMDALLAVDEAHLSAPLVTTAIDCAAYQRTATDPTLAGRGVQVVSLSATTATAPDLPRHSITDADRNHPVAGPRLNAQRRLTLLDASATAKKKPAVAFAQAAELALESLLPVVARPVIGVVANTIHTARTTHQALAAREDLDVVLLIGRSRTTDRDILLADPLIRELLEETDPHRTRPLVVVATQTVEVGLDLSLGGLITENAALAALMQRLGRLDRTGAHPLAPAVIIRANDQQPQDIPVYGHAAHATWQWLTATSPALDLADQTTTTLQDQLAKGLLLNPTTLPGLLDGVDTAPLNVSTPLTPVVHRTLVDSWARTSPTPVPDQAPGPFLHGLDTSPEDVHVLWRADLPTASSGRPDWDLWAQHMSQVPPHPAETVAIPSRQLRRFLTQPATADTTSDLEGTREDPDVPAAKDGSAMAPALRFDEADGTWSPATTPGDIRPGATVVLPSHYSGHDAYGWSGATGAPVADLGDFPPRTYTAPTRLDDRVLSRLSAVDEPTTDVLTRTLRGASVRLRAGEDDDPPTTVVHQLLDQLLRHLPSPDENASAYVRMRHARLTALRAVQRWGLSATARSVSTGHALADPEQPTRIILIPPHREPGQIEPAPGVGDDSADASSLTRPSRDAQGLPVELNAHGKAVAARAADFAARLHLPDLLTSAVEVSAHGHDCGKSHERFQCMLCAGDRLLAESLTAPLAKSGMDPADHTARRRAARLANWNRELRHEALSALLIRTWLDTGPAHAQGLDHDLLTHLVASHHGYARPLLPPVTDPDPIDVIATMPDQQHITVNSVAMGVDWDGPDRFAALNRRYGPWGLALLETLVRLADMACSEEGS
ncbi:type I-G CRISPR-associated helicase/endonuclease Cas3g [Streptomyces celluloflavus]|uniref:type I-G CRISPR-associated helicase/endonuclease Cas3g n=1 Tax=Streptomyces celluloflavus TaxID=58344 RepID=UPI00346088E9|nr:type I-U CRISPR-associated helicase/endonuclease Cas3 [Streptomyces celluloflavus]